MKNWMEPACPIHSTLCIGATNRRELVYNPPQPVKRRHCFLIKEGEQSLPSHMEFNCEYHKVGYTYNTPLHTKKTHSSTALNRRTDAYFTGGYML